MSVCQNIKTVAEVKRIPIKELSRRVDIPYTTLYNMLNRDNDRFDLHLLEEIARSLDVSVGILMGSAVPNKELILFDHYPSRNEYLARHSSDDKFTSLQNSNEDNPYNTEKNDRFPFDPGDKRHSSLCEFDQLNPLGQEVIVQLLLSIRAHQFEGDLRREFIFLLKHSNNKAVFQLNQALMSLSYLSSFNDQYATPSFTELLENLDNEVD